MQANEQMHLADARASSLVVWRKKSRLQAVLNNRAAYFSFSFFSFFFSSFLFFFSSHLSFLPAADVVVNILAHIHSLTISIFEFRLARALVRNLSKRNKRRQNAIDTLASAFRDPHALPFSVCLLTS